MADKDKRYYNAQGLLVNQIPVSDVRFANTGGLVRNQIPVSDVRYSDNKGLVRDQIPAQISIESRTPRMNNAAVLWPGTPNVIPGKDTASALWPKGGVSMPAINVQERKQTAVSPVPKILGSNETPSVDVMPKYLNALEPTNYKTDKGEKVVSLIPGQYPVTPETKKSLPTLREQLSAATPTSAGESIGRALKSQTTFGTTAVREIGSMADSAIRSLDEGIANFGKGVVRGFDPELANTLETPKRFVQMPSSKTVDTVKTPEEKNAAIPAGTNKDVFDATRPVERGVADRFVEQPAVQQGVAQRASVGQPAVLGGGGGGSATSFLNTTARNQRALENAGFINVIRGLDSRMESPAFSPYGAQSFRSDIVQPGGFVGQERFSRAGGDPRVVVQDAASAGKIGAAQVYAAGSVEAAKLKADMAETKGMDTPEEIAKTLHTMALKGINPTTGELLTVEQKGALLEEARSIYKDINEMKGQGKTSDFLRQYYSQQNPE